VRFALLQACHIPSTPCKLHQVETNRREGFVDTRPLFLTYLLLLTQPHDLFRLLVLPLGLSIVLFPSHRSSYATLRRHRCDMPVTRRREDSRDRRRRKCVIPAYPKAIGLKRVSSSIILKRKRPTFIGRELGMRSFDSKAWLIMLWRGLVTRCES